MAPAELESLPGRRQLTALLRVLVLGLLVAVPLVFDPRRGYEGGRPKYLVLVLGAAAAGVLVAAAGLVRGRTWAGNWLTAPVVVLVAGAAISAAASEHRPTAVFGYPDLRHGLLTVVSLAVLFFATAAAARLGDPRRVLEALWFGAGGGVLLFGLGQLLDRIISPNAGWNWARPAISPWTIGSTLGNPNDLSAFLAVLLPAGLVLGVIGGRRRRLLVLVMVAIAITELAITASRGGLLAAATALAVLGLLLRRDLVPHRRTALALAGSALALTLAALVVFDAAGITKGSLRHLVRTGPGSTADQRVEVWGAAWRMAGDHPVLGVGPDVFSVFFPAYASERFLLQYGPFTVANGAHNLFFDTLADQGIVGVAALAWLLTVTTRRAARAWPALAGPADRERRLLLAATVAALVAHLVQASFNTEDVALSLSFWALLALAVVLARPGSTG